MKTTLKYILMAIWFIAPRLLAYHTTNSIYDGTFDFTGFVEVGTYIIIDIVYTMISTIVLIIVRELLHVVIDKIQAARALKEYKMRYNRIHSDWERLKIINPDGSFFQQEDKDKMETWVVVPIHVSETTAEQCTDPDAINRLIDVVPEYVAPKPEPQEDASQAADALESRGLDVKPNVVAPNGNSHKSQIYNYLIDRYGIFAVNLTDAEKRTLVSRGNTNKKLAILIRMEAWALADADVNHIIYETIVSDIQKLTKK